MLDSTRPPRILAVDDDPLVLRMLERSLSDRGCTVVTAPTGRAAIDLFNSQRPDVVVLDNVLPDATGLDVLRQVRALDPHVPVLVITAQDTVITAIEAMKWGAFDYLSKPLDLPYLEQQVHQALEVRRLTRMPVERAAGDAESSPTEMLIGQSPVMQGVLKTVGRIARQDGPALIEGEAGTGKELVARVLQLFGPRPAGPLAVVKCTDFSGQWLESELFGHEGGALLGPAAPRAGKIEHAAGGTLVVDEVGALPPALQSKLFRVLREQKFERLGGTESFLADVNVVATSTQPLCRLVQQGVFGAELYYLLSTFTIVLPPLRERKDDVPLLVDHFVKRYSRISRTFHPDVARVSPEALALLTAYDWPGNVDELQSVIRRALIETGGAVVACESLQMALAPRQPPLPPAAQSDPWRPFIDQRLTAGTQSLYADALKEMERRVVQAALDHTAGNQARAARVLGITRGNLRKKIRLFGIQLPGAVVATGGAIDEPLLAKG